MAVRTERDVARRTLWAAISVCVLLPASARADEPLAGVIDPAPPKVHPVDPNAETPLARSHPRVKVFAKPGPLASDAVTTDWPCFLGPAHNPVSRETKLRKDFRPAKKGAPGGPKLLWQMTKGESYTSPTIVGDRLVYVHRIGESEIVECLHPETGALYWQHSTGVTYKDRFGYNGGPRATPAIADGRVYTHGVEGKLHCLDLKTGQVIWQRDLAREFSLRKSYFGVGSSPLVEDGKVILNIGGKGGPGVIALDARTGRLIWSAEKQWGASYASPVPTTMHGRRVVLVFAGGESRPATGGLLCVDLRTGELLSRLPWRSERIYSVNASSPVVVGERVFVSSIYDVGGVMVHIRDDWKPKEVYRTQDYSAHWMTPIVRGKHLYGFADAKLVCMDLATGRAVWTERPTWPLPPDEDGYPRSARLARASLLRADGAFLCLGEYGDLGWLELTPKGMKVLATAVLFRARQTWTCPVISHGLLYICQNTPDRAAGTPARLLCYDLRRQDGVPARSVP